MGSMVKKTSINLPEDMDPWLEEQAKKLGKTKSDIIKELIDRERKTEPIDLTKANFQRLLADSHDWHGGFNILKCAEIAESRTIIGEDEWTEEGKKLILSRYKEHQDYWDNSDEVRYRELREFAKAVDIKEKDFIRLARKLKVVRG